MKIALPVNTIIRTPDGMKYVLTDVLGAGGFGITYKAVRTNPQGVTVAVAVKEHFVGDACEREAATRKVTYSTPMSQRVEDSKIDFIAEARRLHELGEDHPNIVKVDSIFEANNTAYYSMEYLEGESLSDYVKANGPIDSHTLAEIMLPILDAVHFLHENHVTHLDIKPDNIMLASGSDGRIRPVLIDFGLSKHYNAATDSPTSTVHTIGCSDGYSPMEQYSGITTFMPGADVYSLGATMLFALTGKRPPKASTIQPSQLVQLVSPLPEPFNKVIAEAMVISHFSRTSDVAQLIAPIKSAYPDISISRGKVEPENQSIATAPRPLRRRSRKMAEPIEEREIEIDSIAKPLRRSEREGKNNLVNAEEPKFDDSNQEAIQVATIKKERSSQWLFIAFGVAILIGIASLIVWVFTTPPAQEEEVQNVTLTDSTNVVESTSNNESITGKSEKSNESAVTDAKDAKKNDTTDKKAEDKKTEDKKKDKEKGEGKDNVTGNNDGNNHSHESTSSSKSSLGERQYEEAKELMRNGEYARAEQMYRQAASNLSGSRKSEALKRANDAHKMIGM